MKSLRTVKHKKRPGIAPIIATAAAGLVLALVGGWYFFLNKPVTPPPAHTSNTANTINYGQPTEEEKQAASEKKDEIIKQQEQPVPTDTTLGITLSRNFQEAGELKLRTIVTGTSTGECIATFTKAGQPTLIKTFGVTFEATTASCHNATVPVSEFTAGGTWELSLVVKKDNKQSAATTASIDIIK